MLPARRSSWAPAATRRRRRPASSAKSGRRANSFDVDGAIVSYEWDFDDDGIYDLATDAATATYSYTAKYEGLMRLRVTHGDGQTGTSTALVAALISPVADAGGPYTGVISQTILHVTDTDGRTESDVASVIIREAHHIHLPVVRRE